MVARCYVGCCAGYDGEIWQGDDWTIQGIIIDVVQDVIQEIVQDIMEHGAQGARVEYVT